MKNRKKLKGMTLVEVIVAMAVFAMLGVILLGLGRVIDSTTKSSSRLNKKMTIQAPAAAAKDESYYDASGNPVELYSEDMTIKVSINDASGTPKQVKVSYKNAAGDMVEEYIAAEEDIDTKKYSTLDLVKDNNLVYDAEGSNANLNFKFVEIQPVTEPTT